MAVEVLRFVWEGWIGRAGGLPGVVIGYWASVEVGLVARGVVGVSIRSHQERCKERVLILFQVLLSRGLSGKQCPYNPDLTYEYSGVWNSGARAPGFKTETGVILGERTRVRGFWCWR